MPRLFCLVLSAYCLVLIGGCASVPLRADHPLPQPLPPEIRSYYDYPASRGRAIVYPLESDARVQRALVQFPLATEDLDSPEPVVEFEWFEVRGPGRRPAILVNPILGGDYPLERSFCRFFARQGFHVALVHRKTLKISPEHPISHVEVLLRQGILRIRQVVDWMERQESVDASRMGSFGISMGGIAGIIIAAVEPRLRCHVVALAGGPIADILVSSHDPLLVKPRQRYLSSHNMSLPQLGEALRLAVRTDPIQLAPYINPRHLFMVIAVADRTIGTGHARSLWRALGRPRATFLPLGHYTAYLALPYLKRASLRFFQEQLQ